MLNKKVYERIFSSDQVYFVQELRKHFCIRRLFGAQFAQVWSKRLADI